MIVAVTLGVLFGIGLMLMVAPFMPTHRPTRSERSSRRLWSLVRRTGGLGWGAATGALLLPTIAGTLVGAAAATMVPYFVRRFREAVAVTERKEAIAVWVENLRDAVGTGGGLRQAIISTADTAPASLGQPIRALHNRLTASIELQESLNAFANEVGDPDCDLVVAALKLADSGSTGSLGGALSAVALGVREESRMYQRAGTERSKALSVGVLILGISLAVAVGLALTQPQLMAEYASFTGQLALILIAIIYLGGVMYLLKLVRFEEPPRYFAPPARRDE